MFVYEVLNIIGNIKSQLQSSLTGYVTTIIEDAKIYATHAKKSTVDADDIKLAIQCRMDQSFTSPPPRDVSCVTVMMCPPTPVAVTIYVVSFST